MSEEPAVRRGGTSGRTGRRPRRPSRRTQRGSAENRRTPVSSSSRDAARWSPRSRTPRTCRSATAGTPTQKKKICWSWAAASRDHRAHAASPDRRPPVAERIAEELGVDLGGLVGYQVRFADHSSRDTLVKVMTDGILLAELQRDRDLRRYDTIIIDEAHERSLNIDFLLGYLTRLLPHRPDLKVVITSATIDPQRFADHFAALGRPPRRRGVRSDVPRRGPLPPARARGGRRAGRPGHRDRRGGRGAVDRVAGDGGSQDILVFLSGEREIRDAAEALTALNLPATPGCSRCSPGCRPPSSTASSTP